MHYLMSWERPALGANGPGGSCSSLGNQACPYYAQNQAAYHLRVWPSASRRVLSGLGFPQTRVASGCIYNVIIQHQVC